MEALIPNKKGFDKDPFGYSSLGWHKWQIAQFVAGFDGDPSKSPTSKDLKAPVLWLTHAHATSECARVVLQNEPDLDHLDIFTKGICHSQYFAVALMLIGYSLETCLKAMLIIRSGIDAYSDDESKYRHHQLDKLAQFIPGLSEKELAILEALSHFIRWAGRYPDPGQRNIADAERVFSIAEMHAITAHDVLLTASKVMGYASHAAEVGQVKR